jgi:hypothetical protein
MANVNLDSLDLSPLLQRAESLQRQLEDYQRQAAAGSFRLGPLTPSALGSWEKCRQGAVVAEAELTRLGLEANPPEALVVGGGYGRIAVMSLRLWLLDMRGAISDPSLGAGWGTCHPISGPWASVQMGMNHLPDVTVQLSELREIVRGLRGAAEERAAALQVPEATGTLIPEDANKASEEFTSATNRVRQIAIPRDDEHNQAAIPDPIQLTITEAARFVGVSDRTIREWRTNGKLLVVEDKDGHLVFSKSTLEILRASR